MTSDLASHLKNSPSAKHWEKIGIRSHHGINLSLASIISKNSCGCGEFLDLKILIPWCREIGFDIIQLLPLNDTGSDPSPYNSLSAYALNPIYLSLENLPLIKENRKLLERIQKLKTYNKKHHVSYQDVLKEKKSIFSQYAKSLLPYEDSSFKQFKEENPWLVPYALFLFFKEKNQLVAWEDWEEDERQFSEEKLVRWKKQHHEIIEHYSLLQFFCFQQLQEVKEFASKNHVHLMGDIPILVARDSADAWAYSHLFHMNLSCGAPPDMYNEVGQNWGFPVFNWEAVEKEDFSWWKKRLEIATSFYHMYRIDHIVGFFRFWCFPVSLPNQAGFFMPGEAEAWLPLGRKILEMMLSSSSMLPIGEDLGDIPDGVHQCLYELGICGTKVMRWEKSGHNFVDPKAYPPLSMTTTSTHDSEPLRTWWHRFPRESQAWSFQFKWSHRRNLQDSYLESMIKVSHTSSSLFHINLLQEYLSLFSELSYEDPNQERINIPGRVLATNWVYRMKPSLEEIVTNEGLLNRMKSFLCC